MADSLKNGETEMRRYWEIAAYKQGKAKFPASPRHPFPVSQKMWYDQALTRSGED